MSIRTLRLVKDGQLFVYRYAPGEEEVVVQAIRRQAEDPRHPIDWADAAELCMQMSQLIVAQ